MKFDVEVGIVNDELGAFHELEEVVRNLGEARLRSEEVVFDTVNLERARDRPHGPDSRSDEIDCWWGAG